MDFAGWVGGQFVFADDLFGDFEVSEFGFAERFDGLLVEGLPFFDFDKGNGDFATGKVRFANDGDGFDGRVLVNNFFDFTGEDIFAADDHHFFVTTGDE